MKLSSVMIAVAVLLGISTQAGLAQQTGGAKARGDVYNFWQAQGWQQHAHTQARVLYHYGQTETPTPTQAREHATAARDGVAKAQKSLAELKKANPDNKDAQAAIVKIEELQKKILGHCDMMDKALAKGDHVEMCACCADILGEVDAVNAEFTKLQKALKIESAAPKRSK
ncbi:MAG TPA: hypothetical protein VFG20_01915 [Planctomycetaceae bacterium]|nr:hypothetical protein [Planctomycetaceae bacterium]